jgi:sortase A
LKKLYFALIFVAITIGIYALYMPVKAVVASFLINNAWEESIKSGKNIKPWSWADLTPVYKLTSKDNDFVVLFGDGGNSLAFSPGLNPQSKHDKTKIISGHNDTHFAFLENVAMDEKFALTDKNGKHKNYKVVDKYIIDSRVDKVALEDTDIIKLITCYPFDFRSGSPYRLVVVLN